MVRSNVRKWLAIGLVGALAPAASALGQGAAPASEAAAAPPIAVPVEIRLQAATPEDGQPANVVALVSEALQGAAAQVEEAPVSDYYIGIALGELPEVVKTQLKLEHGLVVEDVLPDSPAAKAEFKKQDILILADDAKLAEPADILKAVGQAKDKEMRIIIFRDGKEMSLKVTPSKRPKPEAADEGQAATGEAQAARLPASAIQRIEEALRELKGADGAAKAIELYFPRPGIVAQRVTKTAELPKSMKISVTRDGDGPAKIHVEREGKSWEATDDKLDALPEDVRGQVERMLSKVIHPMLATRARALVVPRSVHAYSPGTAGTPAVVPYPGAPGTPGVAPPQATRVQTYRSVQGTSGGLEAKIDQILKKLNADDESQTLDKLRQEVERLRKEVDALKNR